MEYADFKDIIKDYPIKTMVSFCSEVFIEDLASFEFPEHPTCDIISISFTSPYTKNNVYFLAAITQKLGKRTEYKYSISQVGIRGVIAYDNPAKTPTP